MMPLEVNANRQRRWFSANGQQLAFDTDIWVDNIPALRDAVLLDQHADLLHVVAMIMGADQHWTPEKPGVASQLTHTLSRCSDPGRQLALSVPAEAISKLAEIAESLAGELSVEAHRQQVVLSIDVPPISSAETLALRSPGALLLLGDFACDRYDMVLRSCSSRYICRNNVERSTLEILKIEDVSHEVQDQQSSSQNSELRFLERPEYDIRSLLAGTQITAPAQLRAGLRAEVHVMNSSSPAFVVPGTVVNMGQLLGLITDELTTTDGVATSVDQHSII